MKIYSNPRTALIVNDWPIGRQTKTKAIFSIEQHATRGERAVRTLLNPRNGLPFKPKKLTFAHKVRIVDGSDGRTYLAELTRSGFISIMRGDMKFEEESIFNTDPRFSDLIKFFEDSGEWATETTEFCPISNEG